MQFERTLSIQYIHAILTRGLNNNIIYKYRLSMKSIGIDRYPFKTCVHPGRFGVAKLTRRAGEYSQSE